MEHDNSTADSMFREDSFGVRALRVPVALFGGRGPDYQEQQGPPHTLVLHQCV